MTTEKKTFKQKAIATTHFILGTKEIAKSLDVKPVKDGMQLIKTYTATILDQTKNEQTAKSLSFEEAMRKYGYTDELLIANYKNCVYSSYISFFAALLALVFLIGYLFVSKAFLGVITSIGVLVPFTAMFVKFSFMAYAIKHRKLHCFGDWAKQPKEWFQSLPSKN